MKVVPPIKEPIYTGGIINRVWVRFFSMIGQRVEIVDDNDVIQAMQATPQDHSSMMQDLALSTQLLAQPRDYTREMEDERLLSILGAGGQSGQDVNASASPTFATVKLTNLTDGYIPYHVDDATGLADSVLIQSSSRIGLGVAVPTAALHLKAGTAAASTAPLKFTVAGTALVTAPEVGVLEPFSDDLYYTISTGVARKGVVLTDGYALTPGRVSYSTTNGRQTDDACLTCVPPALVLTGTTATNTASYGAEQLSSAGWTVTAGWTESPDDVFTHAAGVTTISHSVAITNDQRYQATWTVTGYSAGHFDITFGGIALNGLSSSDAYGPTTIGTDAFTVTPSNDFVGTVVLSLKKINGKSTPVVLLKSSEGTTRVEMRAVNGGNSTFVGEGTGGYLTTGNSNHGFGKESLNNITSGTASNGFGSYAVYGNTTGMHNNAFGFAALYHNVTGSFNVAVGGYALEENVDGSSNVAIGFEAGHWETGSNKLFIDNSARTNEADARIKALIYGIFAAATANQYLTINGNVIVREDTTFVGAGSGFPYGEIYIDNGHTTQTLTTSYAKVTAFNDADHGVNGVSNLMTADKVNSKITITTAGTYKISAHFSGQSTKVSIVYMAVFIDGTEQNNLESEVNTVELGYMAMTASGVVTVAASKDVDIRLKYAGAEATVVTCAHVNLNIVMIGG
jgi:hypothetical protein